MIIVICTERPTTLTINSPALLKLEEQGHPERTKPVKVGAQQIPVGVGVFKIVTSQNPLQVTADTPDTQIVPLTKDGGSPDPPKIQVGATVIDLTVEPFCSFITPALSAKAP